jgi:hypothetical protein
MELSKIFYMGLYLVGGLMAFAALSTSKLFTGLFSGITIPFTLLVVTGVLAVAAIGIINISITTMKQKETPMELYGRVNSVQTMAAMSAVPLGQMLFGSLLDRTPSYITILLTSFSILITAFLFWFSLVSEEKHAKEGKATEINEIINTDIP